MTLGENSIQQNIEREQLHERTRLELENLRRYRNLADAIPHLVWKATPDCFLTYCNRGWREYTGLEIERSLGLRWHDAFDREDLKGFLRCWLEAIPRGGSFTYEIRILRHDGTARWHWLKACPERDVNDKIAGWIGTCTDIHDRKEAVGRLMDAHEQAEAASQAKTHFLANMSHEIRTPLNAILGFSELLLNPELTANEKIGSVSTIQRNGHQLLRIIDEVLDISKIEAGRLEIDQAQVDLWDLFNEAQNSLKLKALEKGLALDFTSKGALPRMIATDPVRLRQIISNLVGNALKFTNSGSVHVEVIWIGAPGLQDSKLRIEIADTGVGIEEKHREKLFNPFVQADTSTTRRFGGTGLGLALAKKLAIAMGGDVWLEKSVPLKGSLFVIEVGAAVKVGTPFIEGFQARAPGPLPANLGSPSGLSGLRVLLAEDAVDNQILLTRFLQMAGATVDLAVNGLEAFEKAMSTNPHVILMDIQMPVMDGYEAVAKLRGGGYTKPIIALTAHALREEREKSRRAGCNDHLTKPVDRRTLVESVLHYAEHPTEVFAL